MSSNTQLPNGIVVMTIVYPQNGAGPVTEKSELNIPKEVASLNIPKEITNPNNPGQVVLSAWLKEFIKREQKILGAIQIMIGLINVLFGIPLAFGYSIAVISGVPFWGGLLYIASGCLTVISCKQNSIKRANVTLIMNIVSSVVAFVAVILFIVDAASYAPCSYYSYGLCPALKAIMVIFCLLEDCIAVSLSVYGFMTSKSIICCLPQPIIMIQAPEILQDSQIPPTSSCNVAFQPNPPPYSSDTHMLTNKVESPNNTSENNPHLLTSSSHLLSQDNSVPVLDVGAPLQS